MDELRDIKPIVDYTTWWPWWAWALVAIAVAAVGVVAWLLIRRRRPRRTTPIDADHAAIVALGALAGVAPRDRLSGQRLQTQLSMIVRRWVEARWQLRATDMTTEEISALAELHVFMGTEARASLVASLELADRVRFADDDIAVDAHIAAVERARALVMRCKAMTPSGEQSSVV